MMIKVKNLKFKAARGISTVRAVRMVLPESALSTVNAAMENIKEAITGPKTYQKKGNYQQGKDNSGHLVSREA